MGQKKKKKLTQEDVEQFDELYRLVKEIFGYDEHVPLPSYTVLRLKGLRTGKFAENYSVQAPGAFNEFGDSGDVTFDIILATLRLHKKSIVDGISRNHIEDVKHKTNYMCKIIENHLQDTVDLFERNKKSQENIDRSIDFSSLDSDRVEFKKQKPEENQNPFLNDLW